MSGLKELEEKKNEGYNRWYIIFFAYTTHLDLTLISHGFGSIPWFEKDAYPSHSNLKNTITDRIKDAHKTSNIADCTITNINEVSFKDIKGFCDE